MVQSNTTNRIDPREIQQSRIGSGKAQAMQPQGFGQALADSAGALAPFAGEAAAQSTGNVNAASVLHAAFTALPGAVGGGSGGGMYAGMDELGVMGSSRYQTVSPLGGGTGDVAGLGTTQSAMIDKMNSNNLQLLGLQSTLQNNMQSWTTKSNVLKSSYEAKMNMINKFSVRG